jgi:hypothetical protein
MSEKTSISKKNFSFDWMMRGVLAKLGDAFDQFTGRNWQPSSSLATSELIERLKKLLDSEVRDLGAKGKFVPHNLKMKMQWDKFSTDAEDPLKKLENELLTAAIDHINDNRYHTFAPLKLELKQDYFTDDVKLLASFDEFGKPEHEAEMNVTVPSLNVSENIAASSANTENTIETFIAEFKIDGDPKMARLHFHKNQRLSVGRTKENDLALQDNSVSKIHASLVLNAENQLMVADTGSTNGTFINGERISYGKAVVVNGKDKVRFGDVEVAFKYVFKPSAELQEEKTLKNDSVVIGDFEFKSKSHSNLELANTSSGNTLNSKDLEIRKDKLKNEDSQN